MKNFTTRTISGAVYVALISLSILYGPYSFLTLFAIITGLCLWELYSLLEKHSETRIDKPIATFGGVYLFVSSFLGFAGIIPFYYMSLWFLVMLFLLIKELYNKQDNPINTLAYTFFGQIYIGLSMMFLARMGFSGNAAEDSNYSPVFLMSFFVLIWSCDTGAYMVGSTLGKHRMFERISPKKSWEGFFGGLLFTVIAAIIISMLFPGYLSLSKWIIFALITVAFDTWGDLVESMIKRSLKVKDSGNMIPGHGGILDRLDSCLLAAPAVVIYLMFFL